MFNSITKWENFQEKPTQCHKTLANLYFFNFLSILCIGILVCFIPLAAIRKVVVENLFMGPGEGLVHSKGLHGITHR